MTGRRAVDVGRALAAAAIAFALGACASSHPQNSGGTCSADGAIEAPSIRAFVTGLQHGGSYEPLSPDQTNALRAASRALLVGDLETARARATVAGYVVRPLHAGSACLWVMQPTDAAPAGQATLVVSGTWQRDLVIEAPHVPNDNRTDEEAAILFESVQARALVIAGAQRCAVTTPSGCHTNRECNAGGVAVQSDPSHSVTSALHAMHLGLVTGSSKSITLQLHSNVLANLNGTVLVSNGTILPIAGTVADALYAALRAPDLDVRSCNDPAHPPAAGMFCGETNAQSLGSNGATDCCTASISRSNDAAAHRFIQLEQDHARVESVEAWSARIAAALAVAVPVTTGPR